MSHPRPWRLQAAASITANGSLPIYIVAADGRKICTVWGKGNERRETAELIIRAVRILDRATAKRDARAR